MTTIKKIAGWRRALYALGLVATLVMWGLALLQPPVAGDGISTIFSTTHGTVLWCALAAIAACFFLAYYGTQPDRFLLLVPVGVTINIVGGALSGFLGIPLYGDTVGTMISAIVGGPLLGIVTAMITALTWGIGSPFVVPHIIAAVLTAMVVGGAAVNKRLGTLEQVMVVGLGLGLMAAGMSWLTTEFALDERAAYGVRSFAQFFVYLHMEMPSALFLHAILCDPLDRILSIILAALAVRHAPRPVRDWLTYWGNAQRVARVLHGEVRPDAADAARAQAGAAHPAETEPRDTVPLITLPSLGNLAPAKSARHAAGGHHRAG